MTGDNLRQSQGRPNRSLHLTRLRDLIFAAHRLSLRLVAIPAEQVSLMFGGGGLRDMEAFPFTDSEWDRVKEAALPLVNATFAEDGVLRASCFITLQEVLGELRARHGEHPALMETEADFTEDDGERVGLYRRATGTATEHGLPTLSIRLSLAQVLLDLGRPEDAAAELLACEGELPNGDESEQASWSELAARAKHAEPDAAADPAT